MELLTTGITFFQKGGIVMYVLLLCSLLCSQSALTRDVLPAHGFWPRVCP